MDGTELVPILVLVGTLLVVIFSSGVPSSSVSSVAVVFISGWWSRMHPTLPPCSSSMPPDPNIAPLPSWQNFKFSTKTSPEYPFELPAQHLFKLKRSPTSHRQPAWLYPSAPPAPTCSPSLPPGQNFKFSTKSFPDYSIELPTQHPLEHSANPKSRRQLAWLYPSMHLAPIV